MYSLINKQILLGAFMKQTKAKFKGFTLSIFGALLATNLMGLEITQLPPIQGRNLPDITQSNTIYSYYGAVKDAKAGVVNISTQKNVKGADLSNHPFFNDPFFKQFFGDSFGQLIPKDRVERSLGSGVIIDREGYIITNNHVIDGADKIIVALPDSNKEYEAKLIGKDSKSDLAVIKIEANNLPFVKFARSSDLQVGDIVFAIGNPFGVGETVTQGIVSALNKSGMGINDYENYIQTDASINPGNSGGALIDSRGGLVGINTAILSRTGGNHGVGFAIPSDTVKKIAETLINKGVVERGYLGVGIQDISDELKDVYGSNTGAVLISVEANSPAQRAGLKVWDLITQVDGKRVRNASELKNVIGGYSPGDRVKITFMRDQKEMNTTLTLNKAPDDSGTTASSQFSAGGIDGLQIANINAQSRRQYNIPQGISGVVVSSVAPGSRADDIGFSIGDVIVQIESFPINNTEEFNNAINRYKGKTKRMLVNRGGRIFSVVVR